jgi:beta-glucuronidase
MPKISKISIFIILIMIMMDLNIQAQISLIQNVENRSITSLNGKWNYIVDQYENGYYNYRYQPFDQTPGYENNPGAYSSDYHAKDETELVEYNFDYTPTLLVPRSWNIQNEKLFYYEGTIWYRKLFDYVKKDAANRVFVHFGAINYQADVYLNGKKLGQHIGGFTPFNYEITTLLKEKGNSLVVKVDNKRKREAVPTLNTDWFNYGGITRDVSLIEESSVFIKDYQLQLKKSSTNEIAGFVQLDGAATEQEVEVKIPELKVVQKVKTNSNGFATLDFKLPAFTPWSPQNPKIYDVTISLANKSIKDRIGFRTIETKGTDILLNGKSIFLRGISIHEENPTRGDRAYSREDAKMLLGRAKELNCNFVRLAHYPHSENMIRVAEEMGILVWEEIPVYWTILWDNPETYQNAENQLTEIITRDKNRANIIIWSMANETPLSDSRLAFLKKLVTRARSLDNSRLISAALEKHAMENDPLTLVVNDPFSEIVDVLSFNQYVGWYDGLPEKCTRVKWDIQIKKPVIISEFGGDALAGLHGTKNQRWTEEFQEELYIRNIEMLSKIPSLRGMTPWILNDFRSPRRQLPNIQDGWNRKGLYSETGNKKKAFYILKDFYDQMEKKY